MGVNDPAEIVRGAKALAATPYEKLQAGRIGAADATLSPLDFGVVGALFVSGGYEKARAAHAKNLTDGVALYEKIIQGLDTVARNHHEAGPTSSARAWVRPHPVG